MARKAPITVTEAATRKLQALMRQAEDGVLGIRVGVNTKGCSGLAYDIAYTREQKPLDEVVEAGGVKVMIDSAALMFLLGSQMDYTESDLRSGFEFTNPNEAGRCGCGESFYVTPNVADTGETAH